MLGKGWVEADRERAGLVTTPDLWLDTTKFEELTHAPQAGIDACSGAVRLYRGDFLSGFGVADTAPFEDWQRQQTEYFRRELAGALEKLVEANAQAGDPAPALPYARRWLALDSAQRNRPARYHETAGWDGRSGGGHPPV